MIKSLNIGRAVYNIEGLVIGSLNPYMLSECKDPFGLFLLLDLATSLLMIT